MARTLCGSVAEAAARAANWREAEDEPLRKVTAYVDADLFERIENLRHRVGWREAFPSRSSLAVSLLREAIAEAERRSSLTPLT